MHAVLRFGLALLATTSLGGCAWRASSVSDLVQQPGERALVAGMRAYDDAQYAVAERELQAALAAGLAHRRDRATAHKLLAFVQCTSQRATACAQSFRAARAADPDFALSKAEIGHPVWGPVYRGAITPAP